MGLNRCHIFAFLTCMILTTFKSSSALANDIQRLVPLAIFQVVVNNNPLLRRTVDELKSKVRKIEDTLRWQIKDNREQNLVMLSINPLPNHAQSNLISQSYGPNRGLHLNYHLQAHEWNLRYRYDW